MMSLFFSTKSCFSDFAASISRKRCVLSPRKVLGEHRYLEIFFSIIGIFSLPGSFRSRKTCVYESRRGMKRKPLDQVFH